RPAGDRRDDGGRLPAGRAGRRDGRRVRVPGGALVPRRPGAAGRTRRVQPGDVLTARSTRAVRRTPLSGDRAVASDRDDRWGADDPRDESRRPPPGDLGWRVKAPAIALIVV